VAVEGSLLGDVVTVFLDVVDREVVVVEMTVVVSCVVVTSTISLSLLSILDVTSCEEDEDEDELVSSDVVVDKLFSKITRERLQ
jgi:hypothetical protein